MKTLAVLAIVLIPQISFAISEEVLNKIIALQGNIISEMRDKIVALESRQCLLGTTPQQKADVLNKSEENRIRSEFSIRLSEIDSKIFSRQSVINFPEMIECGGYGCPNRVQELAKAQNELSLLKSEKASIEIEFKKQLSSVGAY